MTRLLAWLANLFRRRPEEPLKLWQLPWTSAAGARVVALHIKEATPR